MAILQEINAEWDRIISDNPNSNIFHHPAWINTLAYSYGFIPFVLSMINELGLIQAGLPIMKVDSFITGQRWVSLPFTDYCPPLGKSSDIINLTKNLPELLNSKRIEIRWSLPEDVTLTASNNFVLHTLQLESDYEKITKNYHPMHRRNIKAAQNKGVVTVIGHSLTHLQDFYQLHLQTRKRQGMPTQPWRFFKFLGENLIEKNLGFVLLAYHDDKCLAGAVFLHWQKTLTYKYGASTDESLSLRPNNLIFNDAIRWGCEHGYKIFDMGRTDKDNTGLRDFKSRWGAAETELNYSFMDIVDNKPRSNPKTISKLINISPVWVSRILGELLYGHFA